MGVTSGPKIQDQGLIYCMDPANPRSFSGAGSIAEDVSKKIRGTSNRRASKHGSAAFVRGKGRGCFTMDGTDDYLSVPDSEELSGLSYFTICAWVKPTDNRNFWILSKGIGGSSGNREFALKLNHSGYAEVIIADESANTTINATSRRAISNNQWHYVVATWSGSELKVYVDGGLSGPATPTSLVIEDLSSDLYIGRSFGSSASDFANGFIGTVHIYNTVLSDDDIKSNYINGRSRFPGYERGVTPKGVEDSDKIIFDCLTDSHAYSNPTIALRLYYNSAPWENGANSANEDGVAWSNYYGMGPFEFMIDWGDGTKERVSLPSGTTIDYYHRLKHEYSASGEYTITIDGQVGELFGLWSKTYTPTNSKASAEPHITRIRSFGNLPFKSSNVLQGGYVNWDSNGNASSWGQDVSDKEMAKYRGVESIPPLPSDMWNTRGLLQYNSSDIQFSFENNKCPYSIARMLYYHYTTNEPNRTAEPLDVSDWDVSDTYRYDGCFSNTYRPVSGIENWRPPASSDFSIMFQYHFLNQLNFSGAHYDLTGWNVEDCRTMWGMFQNCSATIDVSGWKMPPRFTEHPTGVDWNTAFMDGCSGVFNYKYWDTSEVTSLNNFFRGNINNIEDISNWDFGNLESIDYFATSNNSWNTDYATFFPSSVRSQIKSIRGLASSSSYNYELSGVFPNVSGQGIEHLFQSNTTYDKDISWLVNDKITSIKYLCARASKVTADISQWDLSNVTNMQGAFENMPTGSLLNIDITNLVQSGVTNISSILNRTRNENFGGQVLNWDLSTVENTNSAFGGSITTNAMPIVTGINTSGLKTLNSMFAYNYDFNQNLSNWDTSSVTSMYQTFQNCQSLSASNSSAFSNWDVSNVTNFSRMFTSATGVNFDASSWDVSKATDLSNIFNSCYNMNVGSTTGWDVGSVTGFANVFRMCRNSSISSNYFNNWNVSSGVNFNGIFYDCRNAILDLSSWDVSNATDLGFVFAGSRWDRGPRLHNNGVWLSGWDVSNNKNFSRMFYYNYRNSSNYTISNWDTGQGTDMSYMFYHYWGNTDISGWNTENVTNFSYMFKYANNFNRDISNWNTSKCTNFASMLEDTTSFNQDISKWDYSGLTNTYGLQYFVRRTTWSPALSKANYDKLLAKWAAHAASGDIPDNQMNVNVYSYYSSSAASDRSTLINNHGWSITDRGQQ